VSIPALRLLILPLIGLALFSEVSHARSGGDLDVCSVLVEGNGITMDTGPGAELGANGKAICERFFADVSDALVKSRVKGGVPARGGDGLSSLAPIDIGVDNAERNWMIPVLAHFAGAVPPGRYRSFVLISRPDDHYVAAVTLGPADGPAATRYYEFSPWVLPQLK
jgi:hypothetical protein